MSPANPPGVWAPSASTVDLVTSAGRWPMTATANGWWRAESTLEPGARYGFSVDGGPARPDPRGLSLPDGPHELSGWFDPAAHTWTDDDWTGVELAGSVIYEMHVGPWTSMAPSTPPPSSSGISSTSAWTSSSSCRWPPSPVGTTGGTTASRRTPCTR